MPNTRKTPIEPLDTRSPMRCDKYELRPEPAAPGRWRGGIGIVRENRFLVPGTYSSEGDRHLDPPRGIFGGRDGVGARVTRNPGADDEEEFPAKVTGIPCAAGDVIRIQAPNAAGYGDPLERDPAMVREDVLDDFTTVELARDAYGVVFVDERDFEVDAEATERRRAEVRAARNGGASGSLDELFHRGSGKLLPNDPPASAAGNEQFGMA